MGIQRIAEDDAIGIIRENASIGVDSSLRDAFVKGSRLSKMFEGQNLNVPEGMQALISTNRARHMRELLPYLKETLANIDLRSPAWKSMKAIADTIGIGGFPSDLLKLHEAVSTDLRFTNPDDLVIDRVFATILADDEKSRKYMKEVDRYVTDKSNKLLKEIDEAATLGKMIKIPFLIVGDGPAASSAVTQMGAFNSVGIISDKSRLGESWDRPLYINSSSNEDDPDSAALPLLNVGTTPVVPIAFRNTTRPKDMLDSSSLTVKYSLVQSDGSRKPKVKRYVSGPALRKVFAHNEACHADYFLMEQSVLADRTKISPDGKSLIITIRDVKTGRIRRFENDIPLFLTGPGKERLRGVGPGTELLYEEANREVDILIDRVTKLKAIGTEIRPSFVTENLPKILSGTMIEKLYRLWDDVLEREDRYWPFRNLVKEGVRIGITASGDSGRTAAELVGQNGPKESYPNDLDRDQVPDVVLYNVAARSRSQYENSVRPRYEQVYTANTSTIRDKIRDIRLLSNGKIAVSSANSLGERFDYVILATGYERDPIENKLQRAGIETKKIKDSEGNVVGKGNLGIGVLIGGSALGFKKEDFPEQLQNIIDVLGVGENTLSLWVYNVLLTRLLWSNGKVSERKIKTLLNDIQIIGSAKELRKEITQAIQGSKTPVRKTTPTQMQIKRMALDLARSANLKVDEEDL